MAVTRTQAQKKSRSKRLAEAYRLSVLAILSMLRMERTQVGDFTVLPVGPPGATLLPLQHIQDTRLLLSVRINSLMSLLFANTRYVVIDGFFIDGTNAINGIKITKESTDSIADHISIRNSEIAYAQSGGIFVTPGSNGNEFINVHVHENGIGDFDHGIYLASSDNIVAGSSIHGNMGWGVHLYSSLGGVNNNVISDNNIYDNGRSGVRGGGIIFSSGSSNQAYNNVIWGNMGGIHISDGSDIYISNNTIYGNGYFGIDIGWGSFEAHIEFNNIYDNDGLPIADYGVATYILP